MESSADDLNNNSTAPDPQTELNKPTEINTIQDPQLLRQAISYFDVTRVKDLLVRDSSIAKTTPGSRTVIHDLAAAYCSVPEQERPAVKFKFIDILQVLTQNGVNVNALDSNRQTALHVLAGGGPGQGDVMKVLLASGVKVNAQDRSVHKS